MPEVKKALLKRGYVLIVIGGGITGDCQINDTHYHHPLKSEYRKVEQEFMMQKLIENKDAIPSPDRDEIMQIATGYF